MVTIDCFWGFYQILFSLSLFPCSDLSADDLFVQIAPEHLELRHRLLDGAAIAVLRHLLQQEAGLVVQTFHLNLQLVRFSFELLTKQHMKWRTQTVNTGTKLYRQCQLCPPRTEIVFLYIKVQVATR